MQFNVSPPSLDSATRSYTFELEDPPPFEGPAESPEWILTFEPDSTTATRLKIFVVRLAEVISMYFSKRVDPAAVLSKLVHRWEPAGTYILDSSRPARAVWIPASFIFYINRFELHWCCQSIHQEAQAGGAAATGDQPAASQLPDTTTSAPLREIESTSIPFEKKDVAHTARADAREKVRRARLRVAIAKLRAEELAERYYKRYGGFDGVDSDSELSDTSEGGGARHQ